MAERRKYLKIITASFSLILLFAFLMGWFLKTPDGRKYPDREPVYFWHMWTSGWKKVVEGICDDFNRSQDEYEVIPLSIPANVADSKFLLATAGGDPPDCMAQWNQVIPQFAESRLILPLDEFMSPREYQFFLDHAFPIAQKIAYFEGRHYCMPLALDVRACYYRLDHLREEGLLPDSAPAQISNRAEYQEMLKYMPRSMEQLVTWGWQLHRFDEKGRLARLGFIPQWFRMIAPLFGGGFYNWENGELTLNTPENLRALEYITEKNKVIGFDRLLRFRSSLTGKHGADWPFAVGKRSITIDGQWRVSQLEKYAPDLPYMTAPLPPPREGGKEEAGWVHGNFMIVPVGSKNPQGAWAFIKFWTGFDDPEHAAVHYTKAGWLPPLPQIAQSGVFTRYVENHPQFETFINLLDSPNMEPTPPVPFQLLLYDMIKRADESATRGNMTPRQALENLEEGVNNELRRRKKAVQDEK
ncbi:extracellular solute-binding protein [Pontiella agarivorans]|uniref:Extracellular solute-binding protein n=1 Tax=Pontiella agarivorans TaxID=3038953 RepID=A0ABU5MTR3_9BACT|nr:extracellular solute-binding protein [Pontiella agarivorans]MDZ8117614.1 extracellular solute-binding protein [Pontiella agarivorans]